MVVKRIIHNNFDYKNIIDKLFFDVANPFPTMDYDSLADVLVNVPLIIATGNLVVADGSVERVSSIENIGASYDSYIINSLFQIVESK